MATASQCCFFVQLICFTEPIVQLYEKPTPGHVHLETQTSLNEVVWSSFIIGADFQECEQALCTRQNLFVNHIK